MRRILRSRLIRWSGLIAGTTLLVAIVASAALDVRFMWRNTNGDACGVALHRGRLSVWRIPIMATPRTGWHVEDQERPGLDWWMTNSTARATTWRPRLVAIPLWWPLVVIGVPTMLAWGLPMRLLPARRRRERAARGLCRTCGYDVSGGAGTCPECGSTV